jgi:hypothetical protein
VIRRVGLSQEFVGEIVLIQLPGNGFLLVEGVDGLAYDSDGEQLGGKRMGFPSSMAEESQLEGLEQRQNTPNMQAMQ